MAVNLSPIGGVAAQFFDNNGDPLSGGKIYTYAAGTTAFSTTYTSSIGNVPHTNPIILDAAGRVPNGEIWLSDGFEYKFIVKTSADVLIGTYDNINGINSNFVNYTVSQEIQTATAGQTVFTLTTMQYQPLTNSLSVFVDGVNQYGPGAQYAYEETSGTVVTFTTGLHVGAQVKFTASTINSSSYGDAEQITYKPPFSGGVTTNVERKLAEYVSVKDFGAVGDGVADDTTAFIAACAYAVSANKVLDISDCKLYLASQAASISCDGLVIQGNKQLYKNEIPFNASLLTGSLSAFTNVKATFNATQGSIIYSRYNGPVFTGKKFSGRDFSVMGFPGSASSTAYTQSTPTGYPGWSSPLSELANVTVVYFGSHGLHARGGSEVCVLENLQVSLCNGYGVLIEKTPGVTSPVEYITFRNCTLTYNLLGNVKIDGMSKEIAFDTVDLTGAGQMFRTGILPATESAIIYAVQLYQVSSTALPVFQNFSAINCYAEFCQGMFAFNRASDGTAVPYRNISIENSYMIPENFGVSWNHVSFRDTTYLSVSTRRNTSPVGFYIWMNVSANHAALDFQELSDTTQSVVFTGYTPTQRQLWALYSKGFNSGSIVGGANNGAGSTVYTYNLSTSAPFQTIGVTTAAAFAHYIVTSNFQSTTYDNIGGYMLSVCKMSSGNFAAIVTALGSTTGFAAAPTVSTAGVLSVNLTQFYQARVTRIDGASLIST